MDNRNFQGHYFRSEYFNPYPSTDFKDKKESCVDFYIFFKEDVSFESICAFHIPYSYIEEYSNVSVQSAEEEFILEIILHHKVVENINDPGTCIELLYLTLMEYLCFGQEMCNSINSYPNGGFGIIVLFDEDYHNPSITSVISPKRNQEVFYAV